MEISSLKARMSLQFNNNDNNNKNNNNVHNGG